MYKKTLLLTLVLGTFLSSCSDETDTNGEQITTKRKNVENVDPMVIKKRTTPLPLAMEAFHQKIKRLSGKEFSKEYQKMTKEQRADFATTFLTEESKAVLGEQGLHRDVLQQKSNAELVKEALTYYSQFINSNN